LLLLLSGSLTDEGKKQNKMNERRVFVVGGVVVTGAHCPTAALGQKAAAPTPKKKKAKNDD
jgi:hypothetical protein